MICKRDRWILDLKVIERDRIVIDLALARLKAQALADPTILVARKLSFGDLEPTSARLEGTYLIRLFAEFEMALRDYWVTVRSTQPRTRDLIDALASSRKVDFDVLVAAHLVREYRNGLVHERTAGMRPIPLAVSRRACCQFLARLPEDWG